MLSIGIILSFSILKSHGLSTSAAPGENFDVLSNFYLHLPNDDTIDYDDLSDDYESSYFYTDSSDGAMTFYVPKEEDAKYPRCELREQCKPGSNSYNWDLTSGTHQMNGQYQVDEDTTSDYFIIQQIHSKNGPGKPLLKVRYNDGYLRVELKTEETGDGDLELKVQEKENGDSTYVGNNKFWLKIIVNNGYVKVYLDGDRIINEYVADYWGDNLNYFKTGCYKTQVDSDGVKCYVRIYSLTLYHSDDSLCKDVDAFVLEENDGQGSNTGVIAAVTIFVLVGVGICVFVWYWCYRNKHLKKEVGLKDGKDMNSETGDEEKAETGGYDMEPIDIERDIDVVDGDKNTEN